MQKKFYVLRVYINSWYIISFVEQTKGYIDTFVNILILTNIPN